MSEQRLIDLETKISHQEMDIEALQGAVYEHQKTIDQLVEKLNKLTGRFDAESNGGLEIGPANEKPPHY